MRREKLLVPEVGGSPFLMRDRLTGSALPRLAPCFARLDEPSAIASAQAAPPLFREMKSIWKLESIEELARAANSNPDFAVLFPAVLAAADSGDELAQQVLAQAARELARLASIVMRRLFSERLSGAAVPLAMAGGVFRHAPMIRELFYNEVRTAHPQVVLES